MRGKCAYTFLGQTRNIGKIVHRIVQPSQKAPWISGLYSSSCQSRRTEVAERTSAAMAENLVAPDVARRVGDAFTVPRRGFLPTTQAASSGTIAQKVDISAASVMTVMCRKDDYLYKLQSLRASRFYFQQTLKAQ